MPECAVNLPALHGASDHHVMAAPRMVRTVASRWLECAAEIRLRERRDVLRHAEFLRGRIERRDCLAQLGIQRIVRLQFASVGIEAAQRTEEYLAAHPKVACHLDHLRHLL